MDVDIYLGLNRTLLISTMFRLCLMPMVQVQWSLWTVTSLTNSGSFAKCVGHCIGLGRCAKFGHCHLEVPSRPTTGGNRSVTYKRSSHALKGTSAGCTLLCLDGPVLWRRSSSTTFAAVLRTLTQFRIESTIQSALAPTSFENMNGDYSRLTTGNFVYVSFPEGGL